MDAPLAGSKRPRIESGENPAPQARKVYSAILSLCSRVSGGVDTRIAAKAQTVFRLMKASGMVEEAAYTSIIRVCAMAGDTAAARAHFDDALASGIPLKLRSFAPLVCAYAVAGDVENAEWAWSRLCAAHLRPSQTEYAAVIQALGRRGGSRAAEVIPRLLSALAVSEYRLEPAVATAVAAYFAGELEPRGAAESSTIELERAITLPSADSGAGTLPEGPNTPSPSIADPSTPHPIAARASAAPAGWPWHVAEVTIPRNSPRHVVICPVTGVRLESMELSDTDLAALCDQAAVLAQGVAGQAALETFRAWLGKVTDGGRRPFDIVVDGANVGYLNQNFSGGALMYSQIDSVIRELQRAGRRPLLVMSARWLKPNRYNSGASRVPFKRTASGSSAAARHSEPLRPTSTAHPSVTSAVELAFGTTAAQEVSAEGLHDAEHAPETADDIPSRLRIVKEEERGVGVQSVASSAPGPSASDSVDQNSNRDSESAVALLEAHRAEDPFTLAETSFPRPVVGQSAEVPAIGAIAADATEDSAAAAAIIARWQAEERVYAVPPGTNDDWFWLYATMLQQQALRALRSAPSSSPSDHTASATSGSAGALPSGLPKVADSATPSRAAASFFESLPLRIQTASSGTARPLEPPPLTALVVSNDFMRDHHFRMHAPTHFLEWRERHQVHFRVDWSAARWAVVPTFQLPRPYSHRIQHQLLPALPPPPGTETSPAAAFVETWHFPLEGKPDGWLAVWRNLSADEAGALLARVDEKRSADNLPKSAYLHSSSQ